MSCTFATLAACFQLSGWYIDMSTVIADGVVEQYGVEHDRWLVNRNGLIASGSSTQFSHDRLAQNPYVRAALGFEIKLSQGCTVYAEAWHMSSIATGRDRGINAFVGGTRCPLLMFRGAR